MREYLFLINPNPNPNPNPPSPPPLPTTTTTGIDDDSSDHTFHLNTNPNDSTILNPSNYPEPQSPHITCLGQVRTTRGRRFMEPSKTPFAPNASSDIQTLPPPHATTTTTTIFILW